MTYRVDNAKFRELNRIRPFAIDDPLSCEVESWLEPLIIDYIKDTPQNRLSAGKSVRVVDTNLNQTIATDDLMALIESHFMDETAVNGSVDDNIKDLIDGVALNIPQNKFQAGQQLAVQALAKANLQLPSVTIKYTPMTDLQPAAKQYTTTNDHLALSNAILGMYLDSVLKDLTTFVVYRDKDHLQKILDSIQNTANSIAPTNNNNQMVLPKETQDNLSSIDNIITQAITDDELTTTLMLPDYPNTLMGIGAIISSTLNHDDDIIVPPLSLHQLMNPRNITLIDGSLLAQITSNNEINTPMANLIKALLVRNKTISFTSNKKLQKAKITGPHMASHNYSKAHNGTARASRVSYNCRFKGRNLKPHQLAKWIIKRLNHNISQTKTNNRFKTSKRTFMRASRRHPDDLNAIGKITRIGYRPDIHIYLDHSGSISEQQYNDAVKLLAQIAKVLGSSLYFTSFADSITKPVLIPLKGHSPEQIMNFIHNTPQITGGTEYENVYNMIEVRSRINKRRNKAPELNFMITDFEYDFSRSYYFNPKSASVKNTFYIPILENYDMTNAITNFANSAIKIGNLPIKDHIAYI